MPSKSQRARRQSGGLPKRWRAIFLLCLVAALIVSQVILARQGRVRPAGKAVNSPPPQQSVSPMSLTPNSPSKEYVYLGGKLVATEEPSQ